MKILKRTPKLCDQILRNTIEGSITDIMDGNMDLGFGKITLDSGLHILAAGTMTGDTKANFGATARNTGGMGTGTWNGQFYGPSADRFE